MRLTRRIESDGRFLFRWRSVVPLALVPAMALALPESARIEQAMGDGVNHAISFACLAISLAGLAVRWLTVGFVPAGTSGRSTRDQRADQLNTTGLYATVRNPLYVGNFVAIAGVVLSLKVWWLAAIAGLGYWLYVERVVAAEESFLAERFGPRYLEWAERTPAFLPRWRNWVPPAEPFSVRTVLRREYNGVLAVGTSFLAVEALTDLVVKRQSPAEWISNDRAWLVVFAVALVLFLVLRFLKKRTHVLDVKGR